MVFVLQGRLDKGRLEKVIGAPTGVIYESDHVDLYLYGVVWE